MKERFAVTVTRDPALLRRAQSLRRLVFAGAQGVPGPDAGCGDADGFDQGFDHILIEDRSSPTPLVVATARIAAGAAYTEREFDLSRLHMAGARIAEAGRTCVHPDYRGGAVAMMLFKAVIDAMTARGVRYLVGTASFPGVNVSAHLPALRRLRQEALAPETLRPVARGPEAIDTRGAADRNAMRQVPALIKSYLRVGAWVGEGAWVDRAFNSIDVCIVLDMQKCKSSALKSGLERLENVGF